MPNPSVLIDKGVTSRVRGGDEREASSSNCAKSTFFGRYMMIFGVMD